MADEQVVELTIRLRVVLQVSVEAAADPTGKTTGPMSMAMTLSPPLSSCTACGRSDKECRKIIDDTAATRSCCAACKHTSTHPPVPDAGKED
jgi:hypothetical protein